MYDSKRSTRTGGSMIKKLIRRDFARTSVERDAGGTAGRDALRLRSLAATIKDRAARLQ